MLAAAAAETPVRSVRVIWGVETKGGIAEVINRTPAQTRRLIKKGKLRVKQHGHRTFSALEHELLEDCAGEIPEEEIHSESVNPRSARALSRKRSCSMM